MEKVNSENYDESFFGRGFQLNILKVSSSDQNRYKQIELDTAGADPGGALGARAPPP